MDEIVNKVASSGLVTIDLEEFYPSGERVAFDLKQVLFQEAILREKDLREFAKTFDWSSYKEKYVAIHCSVDAIVPTWAYMLVSLHIQPYAKKIVFGSLEDLEQQIFEEIVNELNAEEFKDARVVVKGCSNLPVPVSAYVSLTNKLLPVVKSLFYGEPCSTVPLFKRK